MQFHPVIAGLYRQSGGVAESRDEILDLGMGEGAVGLLGRLAARIDVAGAHGDAFGQQFGFGINAAMLNLHEDARAGILHRMHQAAVALQIGLVLQMQLIGVGPAGVGRDADEFNDDQPHAAQRPLAIEGDHLRGDLTLPPTQFGGHGGHYHAVGNGDIAHLEGREDMGVGGRHHRFLFNSTTASSATTPPSAGRTISGLTSIVAIWSLY